MHPATPPSAGGLFGGFSRQTRRRSAPRSSIRESPRPIGIFDQIGRETVALLGESKGLDFIGDLVVAPRTTSSSSTLATRVPRIPS
jgi:hypothetical protein